MTIFREQRRNAGSFDYAQDRLFDFGVHGEAVNTFAQDDNFVAGGWWLVAGGWWRVAWWWS
jgi:hypothetical protein